MKKVTKQGFTLVELLIVIVVVALMSTVAIPLYESYALRAKTSDATTDMLRIQMAIDRFESNSFRLPNSLVDIGMQNLLDPWGQTYVYERRAAGDETIDIENTSEGQIRIFKNLNLAQLGYDLFSTGPQDLNTPCDYGCKAQLRAVDASNHAVTVAI